MKSKIILLSVALLGLAFGIQASNIGFSDLLSKGKTHDVHIENQDIEHYYSGTEYGFSKIFDLKNFKNLSIFKTEKRGNVYIFIEKYADGISIEVEGNSGNDVLSLIYNSKGYIVKTDKSAKKYLTFKQNDDNSGIIKFNKKGRKLFNFNFGLSWTKEHNLNAFIIDNNGILNGLKNKSI